MKLNRKRIIAVFLLLVCLAIHIYSLDELRVETGYSTDFSPYLSSALRYCFGSIPFSVGDFFYFFLGCWLVWKLINFISLLFKKNNGTAKKNAIRQSLLSLFIFCCSLYIVFNIFWGLNYDRKGIAWQLGLDTKNYTKDDLQEMNCLLIQKINDSKKILLADKIKYPSDKDLYRQVKAAYEIIAVQYPFLKYEPASLKTSMWGWLGNYTGFTGYYNPFTGEAQLNTTVPEFLHPFIACHETAHQLGYAKEMEANFVGYLAARASQNTLFHYAVYVDLLTYANRNLFMQDSAIAKLYTRELDTAVIADFRRWAQFNRSHRNPVEPVVRWIYGKYLEGNRQPQGLLSYDEVTAFIIAYYKKFGKI